MTIPFVGDLIREVGETVREFIPDPDKRMEIEVQLAELADKADARENELLQGQIEINKVEAGSANLFVSGWRPFIGWVGGVALAYTWILSPLLKALFKLTELPALQASEIYPIILALLGIGTMRTVEKMRGVATSLGGRVLPPLERSTPVTAAPSAPTASSKPKSRWF